MKLIVSAFAFAIAVSAAAQPASAQPAHTGLSQHRSTPGSPAQEQSGHAGHHQTPQGQPHGGHAMKDGCCADKDGNGKMDCCEKMAAKKDEQHSPASQGQ